MCFGGWVPAPLARSLLQTSAFASGSRSPALRREGFHSYSTFLRSLAASSILAHCYKRRLHQRCWRKRAASRRKEAFERRGGREREKEGVLAHMIFDSSSPARQLPSLSLSLYSSVFLLLLAATTGWSCSSSSRRGSKKEKGAAP